MGSLDEGLGIYMRTGGGPGIGARVGIEGGAAKNRAAFDRGSLQGCGGLFQVDVCVGGNKSGTSANVTVGPGSPKLGPLSTDVDFSYTRSVTLKDAVKAFVEPLQRMIYAASGVPWWAQ